MDLQLANNLEELEKLFEARMHSYEDKLTKASAFSAPGTTSNIEDLSREFAEFKAFILQSFSAMKTQIALLTHGLDRHETYMRRKVLLLHGIAETQNENPRSVVSEILTDKMKLSDISKENLLVCHRLGTSRSKTRPILVRFGNIDHRHIVWDHKTVLKGSGITISEFLTKSRHRVFMEARQHFGLNRCWTVEGRIVVMVSEKTRRKIETPAELRALKEEFPPVAAIASVDSAANSASAENSTQATSSRRTRRRC